MTLSGIDLSNLQGHPDTYRHLDWYVQSQFVIVQGIEPPSGFPGHDFIDPETGKRGYTGVQLRAAKEDGKYVGVYVWLWNGLSDTRGNILARLATVPPSVTLDMRPWVDVEDPANATVASRQQDTIDARKAADDWAASFGLPPSGGYSGSWYQSDYLGGWWPQDWPKWWAAYDIPPGALHGGLIAGLVVAHQYTSDPVDQNVLLESEIVTQPEPPTDECADLQAKVESLVNALGYLGGDVLKPLTRKSAGAYVKTAVEQIRTVCDQQGVAHA